eukprot:Gb_39277 [translate_table: standard]
MPMNNLDYTGTSFKRETTLHLAQHICESKDGHCHAVSMINDNACSNLLEDMDDKIFLHPDSHVEESQVTLTSKEGLDETGFSSYLCQPNSIEQSMGVVIDLDVLLGDGSRESNVQPFDDGQNLRQVNSLPRTEIVKDAQRVDLLSSHISLSQSLLNGTCQFKGLHDIVVKAARKLEEKVGPMNGIPSKMAQGIISRLSTRLEVQNLCAMIVEKVEVLLSRISPLGTSLCLIAKDSLHVACRVQFEDVTSTSLVVLLKEIDLKSSQDVLGYKLWHHKGIKLTCPRYLTCVLPRTQRRDLVSNLQRCTEYAFKIVSFTNTGDVGHTEAKCFTKSVEVICKKIEPMMSKEKFKKYGSFGVEDFGSTSVKGEILTNDDSWAHMDIRTSDVVAWPTNLGCQSDNAWSGSKYSTGLEMHNCIVGLNWSHIQCFNSSGEAFSVDGEGRACYKLVIVYCGVVLENGNNTNILQHPSLQLLWGKEIQGGGSSMIPIVNKCNSHVVATKRIIQLRLYSSGNEQPKQFEK